MTDASLILELSVETPVAAAAPATTTAAAAVDVPSAPAPPFSFDGVAPASRGAVVAASPVSKDLPGVELKKRKFAHTSDAQRRCMLEWLEVPGNFQLLASPAGSTTINTTATSTSTTTTTTASGKNGTPTASVVLKNAKGKKLKKTDGFRALTHYVNAHTQSNWTMEITKSRFESFMTTYRKVKAQAALPDFGVTDSDRSRGVSDVRQKLNVLCVYFDRIEALFHPETSGGDNGEAAEPLKDAVAGAEGAETVAAGRDELQVEGALVERLAVEDAQVESDDNEHRRKRPKQDETLEGTGDEVLPSIEAVDETTETMTDAVSDDAAMEQLAVERKRLDLLQQQLAAQKQRLDIREQQLNQKEERLKRDLQTAIAAKLIEAGRNAEVK